MLIAIFRVANRGLVYAFCRFFYLLTFKRFVGLSFVRVASLLRYCYATAVHQIIWFLFGLYRVFFRFSGVILILYRLLTLYLEYFRLIEVYNTTLNYYYYTTLLIIIQIMKKVIQMIFYKARSRS